MNSIVIDRLFKNPKLYDGIKNENIKIKNVFPAIIAMIIMKLNGIPNLAIILISIGIYMYFKRENDSVMDKKIKFLNSIIYDDYEQPFETRSYLSADKDLINFYYDNKWYIDYNLTAYRKSLQATNNLLRLEYNLKDNLMLYPEQLYENAYMEYKEALNNLHSSIYKMISHQVNNDIFNDNLEILKTLLRKHIENIQQGVIKCGYNLYNINIWSIINPTNIEYKDDTKTKGYSPHYSFF